MKNYIKDGSELTLAAPYAVLSGGGALVGSIFGVAQADAASGAQVSLITRGVVDLAKTSAEAYTVGQRIYWNDTTKLTTGTASTNKLIGVAVKAAVNPSASCETLLTGGFTI